VRVLLLNAGSSSLKSALMESAGEQLLARASAEWAGPIARYELWAADGRRISGELPRPAIADAVRRALADLLPDDARRPGALAAVGHRVVHGGEFRRPVRVGSEVRARIARLAELAPLHNPPGLEALAAAEAELPGVPHVAVFDTAFHADLPAHASTYPVPERWTREWGIRRYGFHGLNHAYCSRRSAELLARPLESLRLVICHLGHGCSAAAVQGGRSVDTTMGFTPLEGLMMATRSGSIDPGIVLHTQRHHGLGAAQVEEALNRESGLLGVSGISGDMREVLAGLRVGDGRARLAFDIYAHRVRQAIGALAVTLGGVDALVFSAGVGENCAELREAACRGLGCLGLELDAQSNAHCRPDADVATASSRGRILVIAAREEQTMLREVTRVLAT